MATDLHLCKKEWVNKIKMYECFWGLKPSECEYMNCVNGCGNNWCLGTAFTSEHYSHKNKLKTELKSVVNYFSFSN